MFVRLLLTAILLFLVYTFISAVLRILFANPAVDDKNIADDQMVECAACGTYVPKREALRKKKGGQEYYYCDDKCLKEHQHKR